MLVFKIAWRNILRYKRRSVFAILTIMVGVAGIVLFGGFVEANYIGLRESIIRSQYGHLQIHQQGYEINHRRDPNAYRMSPETTRQAQSLLETAPNVLVTSRRLEFTGLIGNERNSRAAIIRGVDPDTEALINSALTIVEGEELDSLDPEGVILGEGLALGINAQVGDVLTLLGTTINGVMNAVDVRVVGIFQSFAKEYDDSAMMMGLDKAQTLLNTQAVDSIVVLLDDTDTLPAVVADIGGKIKQQQLAVEWQEWYKMTNYYQKVVDLYNGFFFFINLVIYVVVLFGVSNTMIVTVMERTSEIGTLRSMGMQRSGIIRQFLVEGLMLALLAALLGVATGNAITWFVNSLDIMMPAPPGSSKGYPLSLQYVEDIWFSTVAIVATIAFFATFFPALQASRKAIVDALRHV